MSTNQSRQFKRNGNLTKRGKKVTKAVVSGITLVNARMVNLALAYFKEHNVYPTHVIMPMPLRSYFVGKDTFAVDHYGNEVLINIEFFDQENEHHAGIIFKNNLTMFDLWAERR